MGNCSLPQGMKVSLGIYYWKQCLSSVVLLTVTARNEIYIYDKIMYIFVIELNKISSEQRPLRIVCYNMEYWLAEFLDYWASY